MTTVIIGPDESLQRAIARGEASGLPAETTTHPHPERPGAPRTREAMGPCQKAETREPRSG